jgi:hypothetical protein
MAASMTSDPTGNWNKRQVVVQSTDLADHPVLGFNKNWVVVTVNMFPPTTNVPRYSQIYVFDKQSLYASNAPLPTVFTNSVQGLGVCPVSSYDTNATNMFLVQDFNGSTTNIANTNLMGYVRLLELRGPVGAPELLTNLPFASSSRTWTNVYGDFEADNFAPQLGTSQKLHTFDSRFASAVYRNGSIWCTHTVFLPAIDPTRSAIQWWQIRTNGTVVQFGRIGGVNDTNFYAFPSIGVNRFNDVLIGYSRFSSNQYPSANYSFRAFYDLASTMRKDKILKAGESFYVLRPDGLNRWGDYSATVVDPNDVDVWTIQEYAAQHVNTGEEDGDGRWGTWWGKISLTLPANDAFATAHAISGAQGVTNGTAIRATRETGEPNHAGNANTPSAWYTWTAPASGHVTLQLTYTPVVGSQTALAVYTGSSVASLTLVTNNSGMMPTITFNASSGTTYRIAVCGYENSAGDFTLTWKQPTAPYFVEEPRTTNVVEGESASFFAVAIGSPTPSYQWRQEGTNLAGKTSAMLLLTNAQLWQRTNYTVVASNSAGIATSSVAALIIHSNSAARLSSWGMETNAFRLHISGVTNRSYVVQTSTNLNSAANWSAVHTNFVSFWYTNFPTTNDRQRFYRAITNN